jgi:hypothetical protein
LSDFHFDGASLMTKLRATVTLDAEVVHAVKVRAARGGKSVSQVIEEALRRDLGFDLLDRLWRRNQLSESEAIDLAVQAQRRARSRRGIARGERS